jgi:hypothetical protein
MGAALSHRHGGFCHSHVVTGPHRHVGRGYRLSSLDVRRSGDHDEHRHDDHFHRHGHGHSHGLVDRSIVRSREGIKAVALSLAVLGATALAQLAIFVLTSSVALSFSAASEPRRSPASPSFSRSSSPRALPSTRRFSASSIPRT